jgi:hypothetical protein
MRVAPGVPKRISAMLFGISGAVILWFFSLAAPTGLSFDALFHFALMLFGGGAVYHFVVEILETPYSKENRKEWLRLQIEMLVLTLMLAFSAALIWLDANYWPNNGYLALLGLVIGFAGVGVSSGRIEKSFKIVRGHVSSSDEVTSHPNYTNQWGVSLSTILSYLLIFLVLSSVVAVVWLAQSSIGLENPEFYALLAASFGVVIAVWSAWTSFRTAKQAELDRHPYPVPEIDLRSRPGLYLFRVTNHGISAAKEIVIHWDGNEFPRHKDGAPPFSNHDGVSYIPALGPGQSVAAYLGSVLDKDRTLGNVWKGTVAFRTTTGKRCEEPFVIGDSQYRKALWYDTEWARLMAGLSKFLERGAKSGKF